MDCSSCSLDHPGPFPRGWRSHGRLGPHIAIINQENASHLPTEIRRRQSLKKGFLPGWLSVCHLDNKQHLWEVELSWVPRTALQLIEEFGKLNIHALPAALTSRSCWYREKLNCGPSFPQLEDRVLDWQSSPASSLNSWFSAAPNWAELVLPALQYLAGESRGGFFSEILSCFPSFV